MPSSITPLASTGFAAARPRATPPIPPTPPMRPAADRALAIAATSWVAVAVAGQLVFAAYIVALYGRALVGGEPRLWNRVVPHAWVPGATGPNLVFATHVLCAALLLACGALQLVPAVRRHAPRFHRWNGRVFMVAAMAAAAGGAAMVAMRDTAGNLVQHAAILGNAAAIVLFAALAWRAARAHRFEAHRRWALRLYLVASGVWFFRIMLMAWIAVNRGPVGFDPDKFEGPALEAIAFAQTLLPLAVLELHFLVRARGGPLARLGFAATLLALTLLTALGIGAASMIMWIPRFQA